MRNKEFALGVDIGGTHITAALINVAERKIVTGTTTRENVNCNGDISEIIESWTNVILKSASSKTINELKIGIAIPGPFDYKQGISLMKGNAKYEKLYGCNVKQLLANSLNIDSTNIDFINDAAAFLKGECFAGAGIGYSNVIGFTLGTGLGSATLKGDFVEDANLWCTPFRDSIVEDYLSTRWFVNQYYAITNKRIKGVKELAESYFSNNVVPLIFEKFADNLSIILRLFITTHSPEVVVIGGNIMKNEDLFMPTVKLQLQMDGINIPIIRSALGEEAAIIGASSIEVNQ